MKLFKSIKILLVFSLISLVNCSSESSQTQDKRIELGFASYLVFEDNGVLTDERSTIEMEVKEAVSLVNTQMSTENIIIKVRVSSTNVIPEIGIGGFNPSKNEIILSIDNDFTNLAQSLSDELGPLIAHEMHHAKRRRSVGYGNSLLQAMVTEGLADAFSMEIYDIDPPIWSTALSPTEMENWITTASATWHEVPYNHESWFFGGSTVIPRWAGYAIGFKLVQDYLAQNPAKTPSTLDNEPAISFVD